MKKNDVPDDLITRQQAAEAERVSLSTIKRMLRSGELRRYRRRRRVYVSAREVHDLLIPRLVPA